MIRADKLLLFDIDGTLVDTEGAGLIALEAGFFNAFPFCRESSFPSLDLGGATDSSVVAFLFDHFAIENHAGHRDLFFDEYLLALDRCMREFRRRGKGRSLPGVPELLKRLEKREDCLLGILTGNVEAGARLKLKHFDIDGYFGFGAFGTDHETRNGLGPIAIDRAEVAAGKRFDPSRAIIIGDTLKDIACARAFDARVIAVATGGVSEEILGSGNPDILLPNFVDTAAAIEAIDSLFASDQ